MEEYDRWKEIIGLMFPRRIIMLSSSICIRKQRSKSMKLFAQILVKFTWHFWNQLHLGIYSAPPLLDRACDISRCSTHVFGKLFSLLNSHLCPTQSDSENKTCPLSHFKDACRKCSHLKSTCLVTLSDRKLQVFKNSLKIDHFWHFWFLSTQNVNVARFARNFRYRKLLSIPCLYRCSGQSEE